jgi:cellulose synthase/poly-beta-1,6-N-acetylglucosamine synthase-like glycosyltransferase
VLVIDAMRLTIKTICQQEKVTVSSVTATRGVTIKFVNSPPRPCCGSSGQKPQYGLMMLVHQHFTAVLLMIHGSLFLSRIYYCLSVFWCAVARMSELESGQRTDIKFLGKLGKSGSEIRDVSASLQK